MKKYIWGIFSIASFMACNVRRSDKVVNDTVKQAEIALQDTTQVQLIDSLHNFGTVKEGEKVSYNFRFKNAGKKPLVVISASASCGCTIPEKPERPILPGDTGFIKVVFNSAGKIGHNQKNITVKANTNPDFPILVLTGEVKEAK